MSAATFSIAFLNGLSYGMLLFLLSVGLSLIFGLMNVINLAHGSLFMVGAYVALSIHKTTANFLLAAVGAAAVVFILGLVIEPFLLRPLYRREQREFDQVLLTLGLTHIFADLTRWIWGTSIMSMPVPRALEHSIPLFNLAYPTYRLFVAGLGISIAIGFWYFERHTLYGAIIRAGVEDAEMVSAVGINIRRVFTLVFGAGALLAGLAGAIGGPIVGLFPGMDASVLIISLVVIVVGGLGTLAGSFWGSLLVGLAQSFGIVLFPKFGLFLVFAVMAIVLLVRPQGLLGKGHVAS